VLILPTCKRGSFEDAALILEMLRQAWKMSPFGEARFGEMWSLASDGDPKRRPALYLHCMIREITPKDILFQHVGFLLGLNLWTGSGFETQDLDWKHCFKSKRIHHVHHPSYTQCDIFKGSANCFVLERESWLTELSSTRHFSPVGWNV
jgi:hypothetical protein